MARDRSGSSVTGKPAPPPHRWVPMSRTRPWRACAGTSKECGHPSAPCAAASALRPRPPQRGAAGYGPPLLRGFACRLRSAPASPAGMAGSRPCPLGSGCRRLCPPVAPPPPRPPARLATPPAGAARTASALGPPGRPWTAPGGPTARPPRHSGLPSGPSAPMPRRVPPERPLLDVAGRSVPSLRHVGRASGCAPPARGLERPCGPLSQAPGPGRLRADTAGDIAE